MAEYKTDLEDVYFNLFNILKVQDLNPDYGEEDLRAIVEEFDRFSKNEIPSTNPSSSHVSQSNKSALRAVAAS